MLTITKRGAQMGRINNRIERHGDEGVTAFDIPLASIALTDGELNALLADIRAHDRLFTRDGTGLVSPSMPQINALRLAHKLEDVAADLHIGLAETTLRFQGTLASITLEPQTGGMTLMSAKLQTIPDIAVQAPLLLKFQEHEISVELRGGKPAAPKPTTQKEMPV